ncbi:MAG: alpha/beta fold hydrolase, partial [Chloroflexota bacterium]
MPGTSRLPQFQQGFSESTPAPIHYAELPGNGPPMMLLHGIGMDWRVWQAISRRLHPYFHLYMPDLRGHGQSAKPAHGYTLADYAADIEDLIDQLNLTDVSLVGSSLGGMVAVVVEAPSDIVSSRVLVDPPLTAGPILDAEMFSQILRLKHQPAEGLAEYLADSNPGAGRFLLSTMSEMWRQVADGVITEMLEAPQRYYDVDDALTAIDSPTLLLQADPEMGAVLSDTEAQRALKLLPRGRLIQVRGAGHAIHAFKPAEFVAIVTEFTGM